MKIKISKSQWEGIGKKAGWMKISTVTYKGTLCPKCKHPEHTILNPSNPIINECVKCKHRWNPDNEKAQD
jgi:Zn ribbon nucleic-acid-binding protein